ncbi:nucleotidyltransferase family protein [Candidatus Hydrogenedentota bacterium]
MRSRDETLSILRANLTKLQADFGVRKLAIFGSVARDTAREDSDVDIIAEFECPIGLRFVDFAERLEELLGTRAEVLTPAGVSAIRNPQIRKSIQESTVDV